MRGHPDRPRAKPEGELLQRRRSISVLTVYGEVPTKVLDHKKRESGK